jgi:hypothetical protein
MGVGGQRNAPATLPLGGDPVPIVEEAGWAPRAVWTGLKISPSPGFDTRVVQTLAGRYTDHAYIYIELCQDYVNGFLFLHPISYHLILDYFKFFSETIFRHTL